MILNVDSIGRQVATDSVATYRSHCHLTIWEKTLSISSLFCHVCNFIEIPVHHVNETDLKEETLRGMTSNDCPLTSIFMPFTNIEENNSVNIILRARSLFTSWGLGRLGKMSFMIP